MNMKWILVDGLIFMDREELVKLFNTCGGCQLRHRTVGYFTENGRPKRLELVMHFSDPRSF